MILAVDPGASGALAWLDRDATLVHVDDMPVVDRLVSAPLAGRAIAAWQLDLAVVEKVASMPKQGVSSTFKFGCAYGTILGALGALNVRVEHVTPSKWKRDMGLSADKDEARRRAIERWPDHAEAFARKKDDGRAEAALLGVWWLTMGREAS